MGLAAATILGGAHRMAGGITGAILLVAATVVVAGPSVLDARRTEGRLRQLGVPGDGTPVHDEIDVSYDTLPAPVGVLAGPT
jgi:hypothetical protein